MKKIGFIIVSVFPVLFIIASWHNRVAMGITDTTCIAGMVIVATVSLVAYRIGLAPTSGPLTLSTMSKIVVLGLCIILVNLAIKVNIPPDASIITTFETWGLALALVMLTFAIGVIIKFILFLEENIG